METNDLSFIIINIGNCSFLMDKAGIPDIIITFAG